MDLGAILIGLAMLGLTVPYVIRPFRPVKRARGKRVLPAEASFPSERLETQRDIVLIKLRDLDFDFQTGKVADQDYGALRGELVAEASRLIDAVRQEEEHIEQLIQSRREARVQKTLCPHCSGVLGPQECFCPTCGQPVSVSCPNCGKKVQPKDLYCMACGSHLGKPEADPAAHSVTSSMAQEDGK